MEGVGPETLWSQSMCLKASNQALLELLGLLQIQDGMLMHHFVRHDAAGDHLQFIVPRSLHNEVLHHVHDSLFGGHLGQKKAREKALQRFYWCGIRENCNNWVAKLMNVPK